MPNDDVLTLRAPAQLVERVTQAAERECSSMAAFVRRSVVRNSNEPGSTSATAGNRLMPASAGACKRRYDAESFSWSCTMPGNEKTPARVSRRGSESLQAGSGRGGDRNTFAHLLHAFDDLLVPAEPLEEGRARSTKNDGVQRRLSQFANAALGLLVGHHPAQTVDGGTGRWMREVWNETPSGHIAANSGSITVLDVM